MIYTKDEQEILKSLERATYNKIGTNPKGLVQSTEYIVLDEKKAEIIENDLFTGSIDEATATQLEISNASFYVTLIQMPCHQYDEKDQKKLAELFWDLILGRISYSSYEEKKNQPIFLKLYIYKSTASHELIEY